MSLKEVSVLFHCLVSFCLISCSNGTLLQDAPPYAGKKYSGLKLAGQNSNPIPFNKEYVIDQPLLKLRMAFDTHINGLMNYDLHEAELSPDLKFQLNATLRDFSFYGSYTMNGTYYKILPLKGDGRILIQLNNFSIYASTQIAPSRGHIKLLYFDTDFKYDNLEVSISGLTGQTDVAKVIEYFLRDLVPNVLMKRRAQVIVLLKDSVMSKGNDFLSEASIKTFIELMKMLFVY